MTDTVTFDVGGKQYKVARTLLEAHPNSMLAIMASKRWDGDGDKKLFVERDCERFRLCLDYMRDGRVYLPVTISKMAFLADMEYYGIDVNEDAVHLEDSQMFAAVAIQKHKGVLADLKQKRLDSEMSTKKHQFVENCYIHFTKADSIFVSIHYCYQTETFNHRMDSCKDDKELHKLFLDVGLKVKIINYRFCDIESAVKVDIK